MEEGGIKVRKKGEFIKKKKKKQEKEMDCSQTPFEDGWTDGGVKICVTAARDACSER